MKLSIFASKKLASILITAAAFSATSFASTENATAVYAGGVYGKALNPADDTCANYSYGYLSNTCSTSKQFILPLTATSEGYKTISFVGQASTATSDVSCKATSWSISGGGYVTTAYSSLPSASGAQTVSLGSLYVFNPGTFYVLCNISPSAKLWMVSWDQ